MGCQLPWGVDAPHLNIILLVDGWTAGPQISLGLGAVGS